MNNFNTTSKQVQITWKGSLNVFHHIYSKEYINKKMKIRKEVQEYPNKPLKGAFTDKLKEDDNDNGDKTFTIGL